MNQADLQYFLEVAHCKNLSHAAERLGISQPSLSLAMKRLETALAAKLLLRHKKGVKLTDAGRALEVEAHQLMQAWDRVKNAVRDCTDTISGQLTIGSHPSVALYHLPKIVPQLVKMHPKLSVKIVNGLSREINESIVDFRLDVGLVVNPTQHPSLVLQHLRSDKVGFWATQEYLEANKTSSHTIVANTALQQTAHLLKRYKGYDNVVQRIIEDDNLEHLVRLVVNGTGVGILPESVVKAATNDKLEQLYPELYYRDEIYLVFRAENRGVPAIRAFIAALKDK